MITILPLNDPLKKKLQKHSLKKKFDKKLTYLSSNPTHPGLHVELLEPKNYGVYSFRIDRKFQALFIFRPDLSAIEILNITIHYQ
ncbi:hypothetical protein A3D78_05665 [Candidatus Gottesmanbacteria bacterium RIFCSPHIGHO2_02_FULL_39_14]|uniref:Toxin YoeB n=1 Tax=Candidatus Gottesmanbacteria bacterium RIFCSPHIGHO2_02_FULL_39_14 TaxID=1798383 RepID=A0A1F6A2L5_9BACT|nr:MAG: hypothetical protein A3D78_05665 [Candidatus Gottesmanbacteria bacterium RIFCSPHIGHO2_02_FULL_39_14]